MSAVTEAAPCGPDGPPACATTPGSGVETAAPPLPAAEGGASQLKVAETRVAELERELAACKRAAEVSKKASEDRAKTDRETIARQGAVISAMRTKLNRLYYGVREAILFLGNAELVSSNQEGQGSSRPNSAASAGQPASKDLPLPPGANRDSRKSLELQATERAKLAYLHLKRAEASVGDVARAAIDPSDAAVDSVDPGSGGDLSLQPSGLSAMMGSSDDIPLSSLRINPSTNPSPATNTATNAVLQAPQRNLEPALPVVPKLPSINPNPNCPTCRKLYNGLTNANETIATLRTELRRIFSQLANERALKESAQMSRDILDLELEDLTAQLFEQANRMVNEETRLRFEVEEANRMLNARCVEVEDKLRRREDEIRLLGGGERRKKVRSGRSTASAGSREFHGQPPRLTGLTMPLSAPTLSLRFSNSGLFSPTSGGPSLDDLRNMVVVDDTLVAEFKEHLSSCTAGALPYDPVANHSTAFMRRCLVEDVEPCLSFEGPIKVPAIGARKKLIDALVAGTARTTEETTVTLSANSLVVAQKIREAIGEPSTERGARCWVCGSVRECGFRLVLGDGVPPSPITPTTAGAEEEGHAPTTEQGHPICVWCRERVASVKAFYEFVKALPTLSLSLGLGGDAEVELFKRAVGYRQAMAIARVGCVLEKGDAIGTPMPLSPVHADWDRDRILKS